MSDSYERKLRRQDWSEAKKEYFDAVLAEVKFTWDHEEIEEELDEHLQERQEYLLERALQDGETLDEAGAEEEALKRMGSPELVGRMFNEAHNPWIGRLWLVTNVIFAVVLIFFAVNMWQMRRIEDDKYPLHWVPSTNEQVIENYTEGYRNEELVFHVKCDETLTLENYQIHFTDVICARNGDYRTPYEQGDCHLYLFYQRTGEGGQDAILYLTPAFFKDDRGRTLAVDTPWLYEGQEDWTPSQINGAGGVYGATYDANEMGRFRIYGFEPGTKYIDVVFDLFGQKDSCRIDLTGALEQMVSAGAEGVAS